MKTSLATKPRMGNTARIFLNGMVQGTGFPCLYHPFSSVLDAEVRGCAYLWSSR